MFSDLAVDPALNFLWFLGRKIIQVDLIFPSSKKKKKRLFLLFPPLENELIWSRVWERELRRFRWLQNHLADSHSLESHLADSGKQKGMS